MADHTRKLNRRSFEGRAVFLATVLLALALTRCGGKDTIDLAPNDNSTAATGGVGSSEASAQGGSNAAGNVDGSNAAGSAGQAQIATDGGSGIIIAVDAGAPASDCNALSNTAHAITSKMVAENPPMPEGGAIANGTYQLTEVEDFTGPAGSTAEMPYGLRCTLAVSSSTSVGADFQLSCAETTGELPRSLTQNQTVLLAGTSYAYSVTCSTPSASDLPSSGSFTATAAQLILIVPISGGVTRAETFTRQ